MLLFLFVCPSCHIHPLTLQTVKQTQSTQNSCPMASSRKLGKKPKKLITLFHFLLLIDYEIISACILQLIRKSDSPANTIIVGTFDYIMLGRCLIYYQPSPPCCQIGFLSQHQRMHKINLLLIFMVFCFSFFSFYQKFLGSGQK